MYYPLAKREGLFVANGSNIVILIDVPSSLSSILEIFYPLFSPYYLLKDLVSMIYSARHIFYAYDTSQGRYVGCALVNENSNSPGLYIMLFGVQQFNQHRGVGTRLLQAIIHWARQSGYPQVVLHVHVTNYKAIGLYQKVGFRPDTFIQNYYGIMPKNPPHAYMMIFRF